MKKFTKIIYGFKYEELNEQAKENVKQWYLNDEILNDLFNEDIEQYLKENFENSDLRFAYSLGYCQGDGFNIYGTLDLFDFLEKWHGTEEDKKILTEYFEIKNDFEFYKNHRYSYSCKFIDKKRLVDTVEEYCEILKNYNVKNINENLLFKVLKDAIEFFEDLDEQFEKIGYKHFYEVDEDTLEEYCEINDFYFTENGDLIQ